MKFSWQITKKWLHEWKNRRLSNLKTRALYKLLDKYPSLISYRSVLAKEDFANSYKLLKSDPSFTDLERSEIVNVLLKVLTNDRQGLSLPANVIAERLKRSKDDKRQESSALHIGI